MNPSSTFLVIRQRGAALIVALILLMIMSMLGLSSIRTTSMQERMSANAFDRSLAFQAAEYALRLGEDQAVLWGEKAGTVGSFPAIDPALPSDGNCTAQTACTVTGLCQIPDPDCLTNRWDDVTTPWQMAPALGGLSVTPKYFVEAIAINAPCDLSEPTLGLQTCKRFRITATSVADGRGNVMLQSIYATD